jgi:hypothetical protein
MEVNQPATRAAIAARPLTSRSATTNRPLRRANGNTATGRRVRDLFRAYVTGAGNPDSDAFRAAALAAAELTVAAEAARAKLVAGEGDLDQLIRLENLASRSVRRLGIKAVPDKPKPGEALSRHLTRLASLSAAPDAAGPPRQPPQSNKRTDRAKPRGEAFRESPEDNA